MEKFSYLKSQNAEYIEELYQRYLQDPNSVDESWQYLFDGIELGAESAGAIHENGNGAAGATLAGDVSFAKTGPTTVSSSAQSNIEAKAGELIQTYRELGHMLADINPLDKPSSSHPLLALANFGLSEADLDKKFSAAKLIGRSDAAPLREILTQLKDTYCAKVGVEYTHMQDLEARQWLEARMESSRNRANLDRATKLQILKKLTEAESFERFLHTRYVAQKRFSVEGGDALIPMLDCLIDEAGVSGATDVVVGMAHRGRLNVLANIFNKKYELMFAEFEGHYASDTVGGEGDVKYHMGYSADYSTLRGAKVHLSLANNPSHLEFVNPVVVGVARAKLRARSLERKQPIHSVFNSVVPVVIHGDAAFAGQGIVYETIQLSGIKAYHTGGTVNIVVNNQVGFTTLPRDSRTTLYSTDLAKMLKSPIFHVNGDDAEAVYYVTQLATQFRQKFGRDVVIDLVCYRKYGHNEGDEPSFTQPLMYKKIKEQPSPREIYAKQVVAMGALSQSDVDALSSEVAERLSAAHALAKSAKAHPTISMFEGAWKGLRKGTDEDFKMTVRTAVDEKVLKDLAQKLVRFPTGFKPHAKLIPQLEKRAAVVAAGEGIDWGTGEALAFASLVNEGTHVRITGQDCERGTFSHRHSVLYDFETGESYTPLNSLREGQAEYLVANSALSEAAVLGFEFGHSLADPRALTIWEAQFGDFANGAQVIIDQFIASSETKWQRMSGLVMLLPHGYEGQGPEHSSARLERFLQLCARYNMQVCNLTTPAQIFHALRRQVVREFRKPLIIMSPKSLLRHPMAVSKLAEFTTGAFEEVIDDPRSPKKAKRVVFCSGKVYYDLANECAAKKIEDIAIVRVEQLYPWPAHKIERILDKYSTAKDIVWTQEEPRNMGAWSTVRDFLAEHLGEDQNGASRKLRYVGRPAAAAPAVGSSKVHEKEQKQLIEETLK